MLQNKSIHELRGIAQSFGIGDIFAMDQTQLIQAIEMRQTAMAPEPVLVPPQPQYNAKLMTKVPSRSSNQQDVEQLLAVHIQRGLHLTFPGPEEWEMSFGKKNDTGTLRQPLRNILKCADKLMENGVRRSQ